MRMKLRKNPRVLSGVIGMAGLLSIVGAASAIHAASSTSTSSNNLVQMIADKFHLNASDVQQVFDQHQQTMEANRAQKAKDYLDQAVKDGKITQAQEDLIIAKQAEVRTFMDSLKDKSETDRRAAMKTEMDSLKQWAKDNSIPEQYVHPMGGPGGHGPRGGMKDGSRPPMPADDPASTSTSAIPSAN
jgi:hypothetical protein